GSRWRSSSGSAPRRCGRLCLSTCRAGVQAPARPRQPPPKRACSNGGPYVLLLFNEAAPLKVHEVSEHRPSGGGGEARVESGIGTSDDVGEVTRPLPHQGQDLLLPLEAMTDEVPHILLRVRHRRAVRRIVDAIVAAAELVEAAHVLGHVSIRWNHDGRGPAHHMIAAEKGSPISEAEMIGGVAG